MLGVAGNWFSRCPAGRLPGLNKVGGYKMVDWGAAFTVALSGIISVFAVLILLQVSVQATSWVVTSMNKKNQEKSKATS